MALQIAKTLDNFEYDPATPGSQPTVACNYHAARDVAVDLSQGIGATGVTFQSYLDAADFAARGWNAPRGAVSFSWPGVRPNSDVKDFVETYVIAHAPGWAAAARVA